MANIIALDAMGGDHGLSVTIPAALAALNNHPDLRLILVGPRELIEPELTRYSTGVNERLSIQHASEIVGMDEPPAQALRTKKDSSMRVAINLVKKAVRPHPSAVCAVRTTRSKSRRCRSSPAAEKPIAAITSAPTGFIAVKR